MKDVFRQYFPWEQQTMKDIFFIPPSETKYLLVLFFRRKKNEKQSGALQGGCHARLFQMTYFATFSSFHTEQ